MAIIPSYSGHEAEGDAAKAAYEAGMPGVTVVPVPSDDSITAGGSIHCTTQNIPALPGKDLKAEEVFTPAPEFRDVNMTDTVSPLRESGNSNAVQQLMNSL